LTCEWKSVMKAIFFFAIRLFRFMISPCPIQSRRSGPRDKKSLSRVPKTDWLVDADRRAAPLNG
jgi:hypothetical protein